MKTKEQIIKENQEKLAQELRELETEQYFSGLFPDEKFTVYRDNSVTFEPKNVESIKNILQTLQPSNINTRIGFAGKEDYIINSPYGLNLKNPCSPNSWNYFHVKIQYTCNEHEISIQIPVELLKGFLTNSMRKIDDSEHHYFTGVSMKDLRNMTVFSYSFNKDQISWYGGDKTLKDVDEINSIVEFLIK